MWSSDVNVIKLILYTTSCINGHPERIHRIRIEANPVFFDWLAKAPSLSNASSVALRTAAVRTTSLSSFKTLQPSPHALCCERERNTEYHKINRSQQVWVMKCRHVSGSCVSWAVLGENNDSRLFFISVTFLRWTTGICVTTIAKAWPGIISLSLAGTLCHHWLD